MPSSLKWLEPLSATWTKNPNSVNSKAADCIHWHFIERWKELQEKETERERGETEETTINIINLNTTFLWQINFWITQIGLLHTPHTKSLKGPSQTCQSGHLRPRCPPAAVDRTLLHAVACSSTGGKELQTNNMRNLDDHLWRNLIWTSYISHYHEPTCDWS